MTRFAPLVLSIVIAAVVGGALLLDDVVGEPVGTPPPATAVAAAPEAGSRVCAVGVGGLDRAVTSGAPLPVAMDDDGLADPGEVTDDDADADDDAADDDAADADDDAADDAADDADADDAAEDGAADDDADDDAADDGASDDDAADDADEVIDADHDSTVVLTRPGRTGDGPASVTLQPLAGGERTSTSLPEVYPGTDMRLAAPEAEEAAGAWLRWREQPVVVGREWRFTSEEVAGTVAGPCAATTAHEAVFPGFSTADGVDVRLRLANPYRTAATVAVRFLTPTGVEEPTVLRNVSVPAGEVREIAVNDLLPERDDLSATVQVVSGRIAAEGAAIVAGSPTQAAGASLLESHVVALDASGSARSSWTVPWIADGDAAASWLWLTNHADRTRSVELSLHAPDGATPPDGLAEVSLPPGTIRRVDLAGTFPEGVGGVGVTARSDGDGVMVTTGTRLTGDDGPHGTAVQLGREASDTWVLSGGVADGRVEQLRLVNPTGDVAIVDVTLFNGVAVLRPEELQGIEVPSGGIRTRRIDELLADGQAWSVSLSASQGAVVIGRRGHDTEDAGHLVAVPGVSSQAWDVTAPGLAPHRVDGLTQRLGTRAAPLPSATPRQQADHDGPDTGDAGTDGAPVPGDG